MKNYRHILAIACTVIASSSLLGMTAKMPNKKTVSLWLRANQFNIFVRELNLGNALANKEYYSYEDLATAIAICRSEKVIRKTLAQHELAKRTPELCQQLFEAFAIKAE